MTYKAFLIISILFFINPVYAELKIESPECRAVILKDDGTWQYVASVESAKAYEKLSITELKHNFSKLTGEDLQVSGIAVVIIDSYFLKEDKDDETPIEMNLQAVAKGIVDQLEKGCDKGCKVNVFGRSAIDADSYKTIQVERLTID